MKTVDEFQVDLIITAGCIVTVDEERRIIQDGAVAIANGKILAIGTRSDITALYHGRRRIDAPNGLMTPGFVDVHNHPIDHLVKGACDDTPQIVRLRDRVIPFEDHLTADEAYAASCATFIEMIRQGTTCFGDGAGPHPDAVAKAALELGMRGVVARKLADVPGPFGGYVQDTDEAIEVGGETVTRFDGAGNGLLRAWLDLDAPSAASPRLTSWVREAAERLDVGVISHLVGRRSPPGAPEILVNPEVELLAGAGLLGPRTLLAHIGWIPDGDIGRLADSGTNIAHCPGSSLVGGNGWVTHGVIPDLVEAGANVALGTDASIICRSLDMVRTMYVASCVHKDARRNPEIMNPHQVFEMATINGAKALRWEKEIGSLEVGKSADLAIFDASTPFWWPEPFANPVADLVYSGSGRDAHTVVINGVVVMEDRCLPHVDEAGISAKVREAASSTRRRLGLTAINH